MAEDVETIKGDAVTVTLKPDADGVAVTVRHCLYVAYFP